MKYQQTKLLDLPVKINRFFIYSILLTILLVSTSPLALAEEKEERWFEFEVILFKLKSEDGLFAESWNDDSQLNISEDIIDFLQPYETLALISEIENSGVNKANTETSGFVENNTSLGPMETQQNNATLSEHEQEIYNQNTGVGEQPFIRLSENLLQLKSEVKSIKRQSRYQLIEHFSWRQPVDSRANATKIRVAGGFNYSEEFEYNGEKKIEFIPVINEALETDSEQATNLLVDLNNSQQVKEATDVIQHDDIEIPELVTIEPKPLDWVPEIDGEIKVYIHRNYLHVDTNLVYRKPKEITVDIFHLDEQPLDHIFSNQLSFADGQLDGSKLETKQTLDRSLSGKQQNANDFSAPSSQFDWEFGSDFLNKKAEKLFTKKLFNYPLIQERRVKSGELHYFDHPLIGMLIIIRPYETEVFEDKLIEPKNLEISD